MDVLIIGYGKIGRIKARIWGSLGRRVVVYDVNDSSRQQYLADGFIEFKYHMPLQDDLIVDISTPASVHLESLRWALQTLDELPKLFLIEKPLASSHGELADFKNLVTNEYPLVREKIIINESYYLSVALNYVAGLIQQKNLKILTIQCELSKNRLHDVSLGRFTDPCLGSLGIELPHMFAMVQSLGLDLSNLASKGTTIYVDTKLPHNEGFKAEFLYGQTPIKMESYLGDFRVMQQGPTTLKSEIIRTLTVATDGLTFSVEFDPTHKLGRYESRVTISDSDGLVTEVKVMDDNHLEAHLRKLNTNSPSPLDKYFCFENAVEISDAIFELKTNAKCVEINSIFPRTNTQPVTAIDLA